MSRVDVRVAAFVLAAVLLAAGIVVLVVMSWSVPEAEAYYWRPAAVVNVTVWLTYALTGALLYRHRPDTPVGWLLSGIGLGMLLRHELDVADLLADVRRVIGATVQPAHLSMWLVGPVPGRRP